MVKSRLSAALAVLFALPVWADATVAVQPIAARYATSTNRYPHNIMGSLGAHTDLVVELADCAPCKRGAGRVAVRLPERLVFEDFAPLIVDLDRDGRNEIVTVESDQDRGSRLTVWDVILDDGVPKLVRGATTAFIGKRFRWLAPVGAADFDRDGQIELAYVEKPHLDKVLKVVRRTGSQLIEVFRIAGVTNHAIGQEEVQSRVETCPDGPRIILLDAGGTRMMSVNLTGPSPKVWDFAPSFGHMQIAKSTPCEMQ